MLEVSQLTETFVFMNIGENHGGKVLQVLHAGIVVAIDGDKYVTVNNGGVLYLQAIFLAIDGEDD